MTGVPDRPEGRRFLIAVDITRFKSSGDRIITAKMSRAEREWYEKHSDAWELVEVVEAEGERDPVAWRYRHYRFDKEWSYTENAAKIERLRKCTDDRGGTLTNERLPEWVIEPLFLAAGPPGGEGEQ